MIYKQMRENKKPDFHFPTETMAEEVAEFIKQNIQKGIYGKAAILQTYAGDGELIYALSAKNCLSGRELEIDFLEPDKKMQHTVANRFSEEHIYAIRKRMNRIEKSWDQSIRDYRYNNPDEKIMDEILARDVEILTKLKETKCVGDDFLKFDTHKRYSLIVLNPPSSEAEKHLTKAISMQRRYGGIVAAMINADIIKSPDSDCRQEIAKILSAYDANIKFMEDDSKERKGIPFAVICCNVPASKNHSYIWENLKKAEEHRRQEPGEERHLARCHESIIDELIDKYDIEVAATLRLADEYYAMVPYLKDTLYDDRSSPIISLSINAKEDFEINRYLECVRYKYWKALFHNPQFTGMLTSDMRKEFYSMVDSMKRYDFNQFNIGQIREKMTKAIFEGYNEAIMGLFDKLSCVHAYSGEPEETNVHYYNGWKTNKSWKINDKKVILPCYSAYGRNWWETGFQADVAYSLLCDIEQVLNFLDNSETAPPTLSLRDILFEYNKKNQARNIECKYFKATFFKKGTCHIVWKNPRLIDKLNIYGSQRRGWLPPAYGRKKYEEMNDTEKTVIDEFQGKAEYDKVLSEKEYYIPESPALTLQLA